MSRALLFEKAKALPCRRSCSCSTRRRLFPCYLDTFVKDVHIFVICRQERRKEMSKTVAKLGEDGKVAIRNVRRDAIKQVSAFARWSQQQ